MFAPPLQMYAPPGQIFNPRATQFCGRTSVRVILDGAATCGLFLSSTGKAFEVNCEAVFGRLDAACGEVRRQSQKGLCVGTVSVDVACCLALTPCAQSDEQHASSIGSFHDSTALRVSSMIFHFVLAIGVPEIVVST